VSLKVRITKYITQPNLSDQQLKFNTNGVKTSVASKYCTLFSLFCKKIKKKWYFFHFYSWIKFAASLL